MASGEEWEAESRVQQDCSQTQAFCKDGSTDWSGITSACPGEESTVLKDSSGVCLPMCIAPIQLALLSEQ